MVNIAITGGNGFIGRAVQKAAASAGHQAWAFDKAAGDDVRGDLSGLLGADVVIHLAGVLGTSELFDTPEEAVDVNVKGTLKILQWCRTYGAGYVGITMPDVFPSVYTATKVAAQRLATAWHHAYGVPVSHVRAFNAYGPGQAHGVGHPQKILPTFAVNAWAGVPLPVWGDGEQTIDLVHAEDVGRMLVDATRFGDDQVFDAGTGVPVRVKDLAYLILDHADSNAGIENLPMRAGELPTRIVAEGEGWELLDWHPQLDLDRVLEAADSYR